MVARQLGRPHGVAGYVVGAALRRGNAQVVTAAVAATGVEPGASAADVGFGGGLGLSLLLDRVGPAGTVHGVELSEEMLSAARRRFGEPLAAGRLRLHEATLDRLPLPDASLDAIVTTHTIYFMDDLAPAFSEVRRVLRPGGCVVIGIGDPDAMAAMPFTPYGFRLRPVDAILETARAAGLELRDHQRVGNGERPPHLLVCDPAAIG